MLSRLVITSLIFISIFLNLFFGLFKTYSHLTPDSLIIYDFFNYVIEENTLKGFSFGPNPSTHEIIFNSLIFFISQNFVQFQILSNLILFTIFFFLIFYFFKFYTKNYFFLTTIFFLILTNEIYRPYFQNYIFLGHHFFTFIYLFFLIFFYEKINLFLKIIFITLVNFSDPLFLSWIFIPNFILIIAFYLFKKINLEFNIKFKKLSIEFFILSVLSFILIFFIESSNLIELKNHSSGYIEFTNLKTYLSKIYMFFDDFWSLKKNFYLIFLSIGFFYIFKSTNLKKNFELNILFIILSVTPVLTLLASGLYSGMHNFRYIIPTTILLLIYFCIWLDKKKNIFLYILVCLLILVSITNNYKVFKNKNIYKPFIDFEQQECLLNFINYNKLNYGYSLYENSKRLYLLYNLPVITSDSNFKVWNFIGPYLKDEKLLKSEKFDFLIFNNQNKLEEQFNINSNNKLLFVKKCNNLSVLVLK